MQNAAGPPPPGQLSGRMTGGKGVLCLCPPRPPEIWPILDKAASATPVQPVLGEETKGPHSTRPLTLTHTHTHACCSASPGHTRRGWSPLPKLRCTGKRSSDPSAHAAASEKDDRRVPRDSDLRLRPPAPEAVLELGSPLPRGRTLRRVRMGTRGRGAPVRVCSCRCGQVLPAEPSLGVSQLLPNCC